MHFLYLRINFNLNMTYATFGMLLTNTAMAESSINAGSYQATPFHLLCISYIFLKKP